jgi:hypothetical protein
MEVFIYDKEGILNYDLIANIMMEKTFKEVKPC